MNLEDNFEMTKKFLKRMQFESEIKTVKEIRGLLVHTKNQTYFVAPVGLEDSYEFDIFEVGYNSIDGYSFSDKVRENFTQLREFFEEVEAAEIDDE